jgi:hypothetical protein
MHKRKEMKYIKERNDVAKKTGSTGPTPFSLLVDAVGGFGFFFFLYPSKKSWMLLLLLWSTFVKVLSIRQRNQHLIYENV